MTPLRDGLIAGLMLAAGETLAAALTGRNLSPGYLLLVGAFDVATGVAAAAIAALIRRVGRLRGDDFVDRFVPLAAGLVAVQTADKALMGAVFRGRPFLLGGAALMAAVLVVVVVGVALARVLARTRSAGISTMLALIPMVVLLLTGRFTIRAVLRGASEPRGLVSAVLIWLLAGAFAVAQDRWLARRSGGSEERMAAFLSALSVMGMAAALAVAHARAWSMPVPIRQEAPRPARRAPGVLLISVDTLRADRLSMYGYERDTTPQLARLARQSVVFKRALSPGTWTLPGHAAMLTGRFPGPLGALAVDGALPAAVPTLAERLRSAGYRTGAVVANAGYLSRGLGWGRGFGFYADTPERLFGYVPSLNTALWSFPLASARVSSPWRTAAQINEVAAAWLAANADAPFFLFVNYMDTHAPYVAPDSWPDRYPGRRRFLIDPVPVVLRGRRELTAEESLHYRALYDGAVAYVDDQIGQLLARLAALHRLDDTLVIVTSDHGEYFGEHRLLRHLVGPYEPVHRVPLLVRYPGGARTGVEDRWVQLVDLVPTVLDAVGLPLSGDLDGQILPGVSHPIVIQQAPNVRSGQLHGRGLGRGYTGIYSGPLKLVAFDDGSVLLFDVDRDPGEVRDLASSDTAQVRAMQARLRELEARLRRVYAPTVDAEAAERLRAVGYLP